MEPKICPFLRMVSEACGCTGERCAWYIRGRCAVADIADTMFSIAMDTAALDLDFPVEQRLEECR